MLKLNKLFKIALFTFLCILTFSLIACGGSSDGGTGKQEVPKTSKYISLNYYNIELTEEESEQLIITTDLSGEQVWTVSDPDVVSVENGRIVALKAGESVVRVSIGAEYAECKVVVYDKLTGLPSLVLDMSNSVIYKNFSLKITPILRVGADYVQEDVQYQWKSSDETVLTVSDDGVAYGVSVGTAKITATCTYHGQKLSAETGITVRDIVVFNVLKDKYNLSLENDEYKTAEILYELAGSSGEVSFESQNENVVSVDENGTLTAVGVGSTDVRITYETRVKTVKITVYDKLISTKQDFIDIRNNPTLSYLVINDIDMGYSVATANYSDASTYWANFSFAGVLDGGGHKISNLVSGYAQDDGGHQRWGGIFKNIGYDENNNQSVPTSTVKNITFENVNILTDYFYMAAGGLAYANYGIIENVSISVNFNRRGTNFTDYPIGGLVSLYHSGSIRNCVVQISFEGSGEVNAGGVVGNGYNNLVENCFVVSDIEGLRPVKTSSNVDNCAVYASVDELLEAQSFASFDGWLILPGELPITKPE